MNVSDSDIAKKTASASTRASGNLCPIGETVELAKIFDPIIPQVHITRYGSHQIEPEWHNQQLQHYDWGLYISDRPGLRIKHAHGSTNYSSQYITILPAWLSYTFLISPGVGHAYLHFTTPHLNRHLVKEIFDQPILIHDQHLLHDYTHTAQAFAYNSMEAQEIALSMSHIAQQGFLAAIRSLEPAAKARLLGGSAPKRLHPALEYIDQNLTQSIAVETLAKILKVGREQCIRLFKTYLSQTPASYIIERRVLRSAHLLITSTDSVESIAEQCGFPTPQYLARQFRKVMMRSPTEYRRQALRH